MSHGGEQALRPPHPRGDPLRPRLLPPRPRAGREQRLRRQRLHDLLAADGQAARREGGRLNLHELHERDRDRHGVHGQLLPHEAGVTFEPFLCPHVFH